MSPDTTGPWAHREEPPADLREVLRRLDLIERKIDWVARRVSPDEASTATTARSGAVPAGAADPQPAVPQPRAADALSRLVLTQPAVPQPRPVIPARPRPLPSPVQQRPVVPARRGWWRQARDEGNVGRYLLSGAAALLVLLAAVTLIALVWGSVADVVKVLVLGAVSICLVAGGTLLGRSRPRQAVAAATLAGTGGALGYVTVIGAVLLDTGLAPLGAFTLMSLWGVGLLLLSRVSAQGLTSVICALGGLLTVALSAHQVRVAAAQALPAWVLVDLLLLVLAVTSSALLRTQAGTEPSCARRRPSRSAPSSWRRCPSSPRPLPCSRWASCSYRSQCSTRRLLTMPWCPTGGGFPTACQWPARAPRPCSPTGGC